MPSRLGLLGSSLPLRRPFPQCGSKGSKESWLEKTEAGNPQVNGWFGLPSLATHPIIGSVISVWAPTERSFCTNCLYANSGPSSHV